jgi:uncharacterized membrane protein HdeD (DUF308 family)
MIKTLIENWWLLCLRGVLALLLSIMSFLMLSSADTFTLREFSLKAMVILLGMLAVMAGACTIAAGIWRASTGKWWLLVGDGMIVSVAGFALILADSFAFRTAIHVIVVLATAIGIVELAAARSIRRHLPDEWFLGLGGIGSVGFALAFLLAGPEEPGPMFIWLGCYSAFSAICMLGLGFRLRHFQTSTYAIAHSVSR